MKRALPIAVALLAALLVAQPALAGLNCGMTIAPGIPCAPACGMAMSQMAADCPMHQSPSDIGCLEDCCRTNALPAIVQPVSKFKLRVIASPIALALPLCVAASSRLLFVHLPADLHASPPPRCILFRVFRI